MSSEVNFSPVFEGVIKVLTESGMAEDLAKAKAHQVVDDLALLIADAGKS